MNYIEHFETFSSLIERAINRKAACGERDSRSTFDFDFYKTGSFDDAIKLARDGWPEGSAKIAKLANVLTDKITSMIETQTIRYDVTGNDFDVALMLSDAPEYWTTLETVEGSNNRVVKLLVNIGARATVSADQITQKGVAVATLVRALEIAEIRTEIEFISHATNGSRESVTVTCKIKDADQPLDIDRLAFALAHPSTLRRLIFSIREAYYSFISIGIGSSQDTPSELKQANVIDIDRALIFSSDDQSFAWIKDQLKAQGVHLSD